MYYSNRKAIRIAREQKMHQNRKHQRNSLYDDPNIITPVYPALNNREALAAWLKAEMPSIDTKVICLWATYTLR